MQSLVLIACVLLWAIGQAHAQVSSANLLPYVQHGCGKTAAVTCARYTSMANARACATTDIVYVVQAGGKAYFGETENTIGQRYTGAAGGMSAGLQAVIANHAAACTVDIYSCPNLQARTCTGAPKSGTRCDEPAAKLAKNTPAFGATVQNIRGMFFKQVYRGVYVDPVNNKNANPTFSGARLQRVMNKQLIPQDELAPAGRGI